MIEVASEFAELDPTYVRALFSGLAETVKEHAPADWAPLDPARCAELREIPDYDRTGSSFISHEAADLTRPRVTDLRAKGAAILCWTIRSPAAEAKARQVAQNITFEGYAAVPA